MTLSLRLEDSLERRLEAYAQAHGLSKSEVVRESLVKYLADASVSGAAYELGKDLFGRYGSGQSDRSKNRKALLKEKLRAKHRAD